MASRFAVGDSRFPLTSAGSRWQSAVYGCAERDCDEELLWGLGWGRGFTRAVRVTHPLVCGVWGIDIESD